VKILPHLRGEIALGKILDIRFAYQLETEEDRAYGHPFRISFSPFIRPNHLATPTSTSTSPITSGGRSVILGKRKSSSDNSVHQTASFTSPTKSKPITPYSRSTKSYTPSTSINLQTPSQESVIPSSPSTFDDLPSLQIKQEQLGLSTNKANPNVLKITKTNKSNDLTMDDHPSTEHLDLTLDETSADTVTLASASRPKRIRREKIMDL
jgi:hypothetical protein